MNIKGILVAPLVLGEIYYHKVVDRIVGKYTLMKLDYYGVRYGKCRFNGYTRITIHKGGKCEIGDGFSCMSGIRYCVSSNDPTKIVVWPGGSLKIGKNVGISATSFACKGIIEVGDNVRIGSGCVIHDTDHHSTDPKLRTGKSKSADVAGAIKRPVIIKNNVFMGARCIVLKGVTIGENSIIGAGSVVTKNIPDNEIWAGNPAKFIKKLDVSVV